MTTSLGPMYSISLFHEWRSLRYLFTALTLAGTDTLRRFAAFGSSLDDSYLYSS